MKKSSLKTIMFKSIVELSSCSTYLQKFAYSSLINESLKGTPDHATQVTE